MHLDPTLWPVILPLSFALIHTGLLPAEHPIRETLARLDAIESRAVGLRAAEASGLWSHTYWTLTGALALSGLASFGAWVGWLG